MLRKSGKRIGGWIVLVGCAVRAPALDNGLARTPPMGYNSWYDVKCTESMNASVVARTAEALVETGLAALGYRYVNLDDCYIGRGAAGRAADGTLVPDAAAFGGVAGMKELVARVHGLGLKFGLYTDRGTETCAGRAAALGHEEADAKTYASWGVDYLKEDSCHATRDHGEAFAQYGRMREALNKTGRPIVFSLCGWNPWYAPRGKALGNLWRIGPDNNGWKDILTNINQNAPLADYAGPGGFNDPCLLIAEDATGRQSITELQSRAQFSMWAVMASPLLLSSNVRALSPYNLETYSNAEVIAVDQDTLGRQGRRVAGGHLAAPASSAADSGNATNVWARELTGGRWALVLLNVGKEPATVACGAECLAQLPGLAGRRVRVRDLWARADLGDRQLDRIEAKNLAAEGGHQMLLITPVPTVYVV